MKKKLILLIVVVTLFNKGFSQDDTKKLKYGMQVGLIRSNMYLKVIGEVDLELVTSDFSPHYGYRINGFISKRIGSKFGFSIEPGYKRAGAKYNNGRYKLISRNFST